MEAAANMDKSTSLDLDSSDLDKAVILLTTMLDKSGYA